MIDCHRDGRVAVLTIDRPDKANALTPFMLESLIARVGEHADAHALILTGRGRVFSAGADLEAARAGLATSPLWEALSGAIAGFQGLSIAALNGTLAGGAFGMALACDLRLGVPGAGFFYPVMKLGFLPQPSDPARLRALIGPARTRLLLMGGARLSAQQALAFGLIEEICDDPLARAHELCADALTAERGHVGAIKSMI
ncbi:enoyl-CoA hydratase/isomerase family protein [Oceaniglobus trochenteri]|uniref:enoyl-CoA hydratase/isomerase family protein n=1 Tax=Oceaniglobus trochenteri TaxID=2763260 RepID=UPI001CFFC728|nr:enoyl-CoA hydratase/isomerase family protein [Oceaniglobus trochenteri]